ncbi:hypothetical protein [Piscinibacter sakaiensis]|uniref:Uncharacterized protein n=1 Tax=Piscinibacter sakaiensis TaxID=1547922 RepID=A0A0K8NXP5_PISS1|nr:hypothetical protein [Piscinibacter sakaiensis]GAP35084.1 hypothetical protein ISF6_0649 [Piscinibacter sakaiensis]
MPLSADCPAHVARPAVPAASAAAAAWRSVRALPLVLPIFLPLAACMSLPPLPASDPAPPALPAPVASAPVAAPEPPPPAPAPAPPRTDPADAAARQVLAASERLRALPTPELVREVVRLSEGPPSPGTSIEMALGLGLTRSPGDIARAIGLLEGLLRSAAPEAAPWQPWARLLLARYAEQRRLEDQLERQAQQLREQQRRVDQLASQLEALKAIERSMAPRPGAASPTAPGPAPAGNAPAPVRNAP